jgi:DNA-binding winged helix-turn-helix (wHTH) protein
MDRQANRFYDFGEYRIDGVERVLLRAGEPLPLTAKVFDILLLLIENRGHVVEKERLMKEIWPDAFVE